MRIRLFSQYLYAPLLWLALADITLAFLAVCAGDITGFHAGSRGPAASPSRMWDDGTVFALGFSICGISLGLYSTRQRAGLSGVATRIALAAMLASFALGLAAHFIPDYFSGGLDLLWATVLAIAAVCIVRVVFIRVFFDAAAFRRRVLVYGAGRQAQTIRDLRRRADQRGFAIIGYLPSGDEPVVVESSHIVSAAPALAAFADENDIDEIVVAMDDRRRHFPVADLLDCRLAGVDVTDIASFLERETGKVRIDILNPSWIIFGEGFRRDRVRLFTARAFDLAAALGILFFAWPVMLAAATAIKLEDGIGAPTIYRQRRVGLLGRPFEVLKFRSMRVDAESDGTARWAKSGDTRVTRVGNFFRRVRIDELPQLVNVLKGEMSFVGPRPERPEFVAELERTIPYYRERHSVKPGITGWAQLCYPYGASERDAIEKLQYDLYYVKNQSFLFDLMILLQTAEVILWRKGSR